MGSWFSHSKAAKVAPPEELEFPAADNTAPVNEPITEEDARFAAYEKLLTYARDNDIYATLHREMTQIIASNPTPPSQAFLDYEERYQEYSKPTSNRMDNITMLNHLFDDLKKSVYSHSSPSKAEYKLLMKIALQIKVLSIKEQRELREKLILIDEGRVLKLEGVVVV